MRWSFETARSIRFGRDVSEELAPLARSFGRRVLLVTGQSPRRFAKRIDAMRDLDLELMQVSVTGEPSLSWLDDSLAQARDFAPDVVVGLGGGSAIDGAKSLAGVLPKCR